MIKSHHYPHYQKERHQNLNAVEPGDVTASAERIDAPRERIDRRDGKNRELRHEQTDYHIRVNVVLI